jgi:hypothetical protein
MIALAAVSGCEFAESTDSSAIAAQCTTPAECNGAQNPMRTCNPNQDAYDCQILTLAAASAEPDPMIFKAQVSLESNFDVVAVSPDTPCGTKAGWTVDESKSFGLMQLTPACGWLKKAILPNGHPNLERDQTSPMWATSVFNPTLNIEEGVRAIQVDRAAVTANFSGCSVTQYTMMALAAFNQGEQAVTGCTSISASGKNYISAVLVRYQTLAKAASYPYPYTP